MHKSGEANMLRPSKNFRRAVAGAVMGSAILSPLSANAETISQSQLECMERALSDVYGQKRDSDAYLEFKKNDDGRVSFAIIEDGTVTKPGQADDMIHSHAQIVIDHRGISMNSTTTQSSDGIHAMYGETTDFITAQIESFRQNATSIEEGASGDHKKTAQRVGFCLSPGS